MLSAVEAHGELLDCPYRAALKGLRVPLEEFEFPFGSISGRFRVQLGVSGDLVSISS